MNALVGPIVEDQHHVAFRERVLPQLKQELGKDVYDAWFLSLQMERVADGVGHLTVRTPFLKHWICARFANQLLKALCSAFPSVSRFELSVRSGSPVAHVTPSMAGIPSEDVPIAAITFPAKSEEAQKLQTSSVPRPAVDPLSGSPLDHRLTFETFHVGKSNLLAHSAALQVANESDVPLYNPLYVHGAVGLGKTHLLQAIAHAVTEQKRRVIYLTAEKFMYGFVLALKAQTSLAFKERLRGIDVLVIDDVQFLQGKSIQQEFCHTINALIDARKQIIIAADRPPADLESLEERMRSRLSGGLCVEIGPLDEALGVKMLESRVAVARATMPGFDVSPAVIAYVASVIQTNGRDLDGAVNRLMAHASLTQAHLTVETAEAAIRDLIRTREPKRVKIEDIQKLVATHSNVTRGDILSSRRTANVVRPRQIAMYLSKVLTLRSLPEIGRRFGGRDHTTVLHAFRKIESMIAKDEDLAKEVGSLRSVLENA